MTANGRSVATGGPGRPDFLTTYLPYLLRQADQTLSAAFYEALNSHGVQRSEWRVLAVLAERGSLSMRELTAVALSPQPTVTHAVSRLEGRGLVQRLQGVEDRRQRFVSTTAAGSRLAATLIAEARSLEANVLEEAGADDLTQLLTGLRSLIAKLEIRHDGLRPAGASGTAHGQQNEQRHLPAEQAAPRHAR